MSNIDPKKSNQLDAFSPAVIAHLNILQQMISRFSGYCVHAKSMCVTMVGAITAIAISGKNPSILSVCFFPVLIFSILDAICLSLERQIRREYTSLVLKIHSGNLASHDVLIITIDKDYLKLKNIVNSYKSWSIGLVYSYILALILFMNYAAF